MVDMPPRARFPSYYPRCPLFAGSVRLVVDRGLSCGVALFNSPYMNTPAVCGTPDWAYPQGAPPQHAALLSLLSEGLIISPFPFSLIPFLCASARRPKAESEASWNYINPRVCISFLTACFFLKLSWAFAITWRLAKRGFCLHRPYAPSSSLEPRSSPSNKISHFGALCNTSIDDSVK